MGVEHDWMFNRLISHEEVEKMLDEALELPKPKVKLTQKISDLFTKTSQTAPTTTQDQQPFE